jgi:hypothetical protein
MNKMNSITKIAAALILGLILLPGMVLGYEFGPPDHRCGDPPDYANCTLCHNSFPVNSGPGSVTISGLPTSYTPGNTYTFTVTTAQTGQSRWGFELTVIQASGSRGGQLVVTDSLHTQISVNVPLNRDFMKHNTPGTYPGTPSGHTWTMNWIAPIAGTGTVRFYVAGNAANNDTTNQNDYIYLANAMVYQAGALPALDVSAAPIGPPLPQVPAAGGSFSFNIYLSRVIGPMAPYAVWARVRNPNGSYTGNLLGPVTINTPVGLVVNRVRNLTVPNTWASGYYTYLIYGNPTFVYPAADSGWFYFSKLLTLGNGPLVWGEATCDGEPLPGEVVSATPATFALTGATPNPFNPTTTIGYTLPEAVKVSLNVYDLQGRLVSTLLNEQQEAGQHQATFNGSNLASGVYLYTLTAGSNTATGKMVLMK